METADLLRALQEVEKRAERVYDDQHVINTYVEAGALVNALAATDNGIIAGRRGTGKTHALRYLAETERVRKNFVAYVDVDKDIGSTGSLYSDPTLSLPERATRLLIDMLGILHDLLLRDALELECDRLIRILEQMFDHLGEVMVTDQAEAERSLETESESSATSRASFLASVQPHLELGISASGRSSKATTARVKATGPVRNRVHFGAVGGLMAKALTVHPARRCWFLFDEWSSLPLDLQPYLAEMLRRLFFGLPKVTVRIAVIPHRTAWRVVREGEVGYLGLEMGAEIFPLLDLDEFVVFPAPNRQEQIDQATEFFRTLLFHHLNHLLAESVEETLESPDELVSLLFTQVTALHEMIRAAEGVPRDALTIVSRAALRASSRKISTGHIHDAAAQVYLATKAALLNSVPAARRLLDAIVGEVIAQKKARAFLLSWDHADHPLIRQLVDERLLHVIKRGYANKEDPDGRYDVLQIDYGCYVHLLRTTGAPNRLFGEEGPSDDVALGALYGDLEVPEDDYRAIRRAILDLPTVLRQIDAVDSPSIHP